MKCSQTISIEQKYGKYLFDKKIRTKNLLSKEVTIKTKEEILKPKDDFESHIKDVKEEKKKFIQIIQSFEEPLSSDKVTLENLSFISDIKMNDSQFTIKLKEEFPNISNDTIKSEFLSNTFLETNNINNDINIIDFKKNYFIEPLLNNYKFNKNIKIINNDILDKNEKKKEKEGEEEEEEDEEEELINKKRKIIIKSLIYFNKDNIANGVENFEKRNPDLNKSKFEEDNKFEKNVYMKIEDRIREYLNKYKCDKLSQLRDFENNYLNKIINFQNRNENYKYLSMKGIILGLLNIINDWIGKEYLKSLEEKNIENDKCEFILDFYEKYEIMKKICCFLEKDFVLLIDNFKKDFKLKFKIVNLFSDIYWDYVFRIKEINIYFTNNFNSDKIGKEVIEKMDNIIDILFNIDLPYKKKFGDFLNINSIKSENIFLMDYIIKYKKPLNKNNINNEKEINNNKLKNSLSCDKILNNKKNNINEEDNNIKDNIEEDNKNKINIEENNNSNNSNVISEDISTNDCNNINNSISNELDDKKIIDLNLGKSLSMDNCNNKLSDKDSLEKVYNYILYGENENEKKKQKKRHKKKKKNKNNTSLILEENEKEKVDPIVEEYKNYINNINKNYNKYFKKIKPNIKKEWINSLSILNDE